MLSDPQEKRKRAQKGDTTKQKGKQEERRQEGTGCRGGAVWGRGVGSLFQQGLAF